MNQVIHYVGLDVHKETIAVSIAPANATEVRRYGIIGGTLDAVDKLIKKLSADPVELRWVYEAGPCGFVLCRHLRSKGFVCQVVAPSLIPKKASDRVKTDRRDADQLARLYRAGELTAIHVPDQEDEAIRDLVRARTSAVVEQRKARNRLKGFLLRLGYRYTGKSGWNDAHKRYLSSLVMPRPAQQIAFQEYIHAINDATERLERLSQAVEGALAGWKWEPVVRALMSLRGVQVLTGMTLVAEVGDFSRFDNARSLMHFFGLTPSEHSSGGSRVQGGITKCGNVHCRRVLTEAAWHGGAAHCLERTKTITPAVQTTFGQKEERDRRRRGGAGADGFCVGDCPPGQTRRATGGTSDPPHVPRQNLSAPPGQENAAGQITFKQEHGCPARAEPSSWSSR
jgi:transposase